MLCFQNWESCRSKTWVWGIHEDFPCIETQESFTFWPLDYLSSYKWLPHYCRLNILYRSYYSEFSPLDLTQSFRIYLHGSSIYLRVLKVQWENIENIENIFFVSNFWYYYPKDFAVQFYVRSLKNQSIFEGLWSLFFVSYSKVLNMKFQYVFGIS